MQDIEDKLNLFQAILRIVVCNPKTLIYFLII